MKIENKKLMQLKHKLDNFMTIELYMLNNYRKIEKN